MLGDAVVFPADVEFGETEGDALQVGEVAIEAVPFEESDPLVGKFVVAHVDDEAQVFDGESVVFECVDRVGEVAEEAGIGKLEFVARVEERGTFVIKLVACLEDGG